MTKFDFKPIAYFFKNGTWLTEEECKLTQKQLERRKIKMWNRLLKNSRVIEFVYKKSDLP
ncbi:MAG: hypothetical protein WC389_19725 [Lutibacter sp.]|jgi:hypothetical protein